MKSHITNPLTSNCARDAQGRLVKMTRSQIQDQVGDLYDVNLVPGFSHSVSSRRIDEYSDRPFSFGNLRRAFIIKQQPGRRFTWRTDAIESALKGHSVFLFEFGMGNGSPTFQPTGRFILSVNHTPILSFCVTKYSEVWWNHDCDAAFAYQMRTVKAAPFGVGLHLDSHIRDEGFASFGWALLRLPNTYLSSDRTVDLTISGDPEGEVTEQWCRVGDIPNAIEDNNYFDGLFRVVHDEKIPAQLGHYNYYWGDIHNHSGESLKLDDQGCGVTPAASVYQYARDVGNLDFFALTEHDWQMEPDDWQRRQKLAAEYHEPQRFVTILAQEWTSQDFGHRNIYFERDDVPFVVSDIENRYNTIDPRNPSPVELWNILETQGIECVTIPHHPSVGQFPLHLSEYYHPKYDVAVEIYSSWGSSEYAGNPLTDGADRFEGLDVLDMLMTGREVGFVAASDSHDGHPGNAQGAVGHRDHLFHYLGSGRTVILANELTRPAIFEALRSRRCYATTGAPIVLGFSVNDHIMGSKVVLNPSDRDPVRLDITVQAPVELTRVDLVKNGDIIESFVPLGRMFHRTVTDRVDDGRNFYYVRVLQRDNEMAWSSPIWVTRTE